MDIATLFGELLFYIIAFREQNDLKDKQDSLKFGDHHHEAIRQELADLVRKTSEIQSETGGEELKTLLTKYHEGFRIRLGFGKRAAILAIKVDLTQGTSLSKHLEGAIEQ